MQIYWSVLVSHHPLSSPLVLLPCGPGAHRGWNLNRGGCHCGDRPHLAVNIVTMSPSALNGKTNNCMEDLSVKDIGILGFSFGIFEIWKSEICTTELCFSLHERKVSCQNYIFIVFAKLQLLFLFFFFF